MAGQYAHAFAERKNAYVRFRESTSLVSWGKDFMAEFSPARMFTRENFRRRNRAANIETIERRTNGYR
jgi:hypothetical protein